MVSNMIKLDKTTWVARFGDPRQGFALVDIETEVRVCPLTGLKTRLTPLRIKGQSLHEDDWPEIADAVAASLDDCPFCPDVLATRACALDAARFGVERLTRGDAVVFPNLSPYGPYSAVTVIGREHYTEVGAYDPARYGDAFLLSRDYLRRIAAFDPAMRFGAITQNHLPASGGTLVHPHLQVQADADGPTFPLLLRDRQRAFTADHGASFWPALVRFERERGERFIGATGPWDWLTMWAPQGFLEVWGVADVPATLDALTDELVAAMVDGLLRLQRWYRRRNRNSFNLAVYLSEPADGAVRLTCRMLARNNWARYARNDRSFFEVVLGEQVTDQRPEDWASQARDFF